MKKLYDLKEKLCDQLKDYSDKELSTSSLEIIDKLADVILDIEKIIENGESRGMDGYSGSYRMPYMNGMYDATITGSYGRGRGMMHPGTYGGGYSRHGDMISELTEMMNEAPDERTRMEFQNLIQKMQRM